MKKKKKRSWITIVGTNTDLGIERCLFNVECCAFRLLILVNGDFSSSSSSCSSSSSSLRVNACLFYCVCIFFFFFFLFRAFYVFIGRFLIFMNWSVSRTIDFVKEVESVLALSRPLLSLALLNVVCWRALSWFDSNEMSTCQLNFNGNQPEPTMEDGTKTHTLK